MSFAEGSIDGVVLKPLRKYADARGWLCELFRNDELDAQYQPVMGYISETQAGVVRGPHEHRDQADCFCFLGPGNFRLHLWDNRPSSRTYNCYHTCVVGADNPMLTIIPPGVVHAYHNISPTAGIVINCPNKLYKGPGRKEPVDEIRHEEDPHSRFVLPARRES